MGFRSTVLSGSNDQVLQGCPYAGFVPTLCGWLPLLRVYCWAGPPCPATHPPKAGAILGGTDWLRLPAECGVAGANLQECRLGGVGLQGNAEAGQAMLARQMECQK